MAYQYNDTGSHQLGFRADEDQRTQLDDIHYAVEVLSEAADQCEEIDMRTADVFAALDYLGSIASRKAALIAFRRGLDVEHPDQRLHLAQARLSLFPPGLRLCRNHR